MNNIISFLESKEDIFLILTAYPVIQILALDLGINLPQQQQDLLIKNKILHPLLLYSTAFTITNKHNLAIITVILYYLIFYYYNNNSKNNLNNNNDGNEGSILYRSLHRHNF